MPSLLPPGPSSRDHKSLPSPLPQSLSMQFRSQVRRKLHTFVYRKLNPSPLTEKVTTISTSTTTVPVNRVLNFCTILTLTRLTSCTVNVQRHFLFFKKSLSCPSPVNINCLLHVHNASCSKSTVDLLLAPVCFRETKPVPGCTEDVHPLVILSLPVSMDSLGMCPLRNSNDSNTMIAEGDFPPDLETSDVSFSVHQQNGEENDEEKEGREYTEDTQKYAHVSPTQLFVLLLIPKLHFTT